MIIHTCIVVTRAANQYLDLHPAQDTAPQQGLAGASLADLRTERNLPV